VTDPAHIPNIWYQPASEGVEECLIIQVDGPKRYRRIWNPGALDEKAEWGWGLHSTAIPLIAGDKP
jgi:hypothetical protein